MLQAIIRNRGIWMATLVLSGLAVGQPTQAQKSKAVWGSLTVQSKASSSERVAYFKRNLHPHPPSAFANPEYHKTIVRLNWFDNGLPRTGIVNLKRTFDIYGLFQGSSVELSEQAKAILDDLGRAITSQGIDVRKYVIAGHSIDKGGKRADQELSKRRAQAVRSYLQTKFDVDASRLVPVGFGSHNLKDKGNPKKTENNRIEICLIEDLYDAEPKTTVQLPNRQSTGPQKITIASTEVKSHSAQRAEIKQKRTGRISHAKPYVHRVRKKSQPKRRYKELAQKRSKRPTYRKTYYGDQRRKQRSIKVSVPSHISYYRKSIYDYLGCIWRSTNPWKCPSRL